MRHLDRFEVVSSLPYISVQSRRPRLRFERGQFSCNRLRGCCYGWGGGGGEGSTYYPYRPINPFCERKCFLTAEKEWTPCVSLSQSHITRSSPPRPITPSCRDYLSLLVTVGWNGGWFWPELLPRELCDREGSPWVDGAS